MINTSFNDLVITIKKVAEEENGFVVMTNKIVDYVESLPLTDFLEVLCEVGTIPEHVEHDSTEEKLYSKATDIVLSRSLTELGLKSKVLKERGNSADVLAESRYYNYSLVGDAKAFRLSRTAKNQKDFKVESMNHWRGDENEYAVLVSPYNQYPSTASQIYSQALNVNVCLLSWEHLYFLIKNEIKETIDCNLSFIWDTSAIIASDPKLAFAERNKCFLHKIQEIICKKLSIEEHDFDVVMNYCNKKTVSRGYSEISFWEREIDKIKGYTKEQAIAELLKAKKIQEKIKAIKKYIDDLGEGNE